MSIHISLKPLNNTELSSLCNQMSMLLQSGISVQEGLSIMKQDLEGTDGYNILSQIEDEINNGSTIYKAFESCMVFPHYMVSMINMGETSGHLDEVFTALADYYKNEESIAQSLRSAVRYPSIMVAMMIIVIFVLLIKVLPVFSQVYAQLGGAVSGLAAGIINAGSAMGAYAVPIIGAALTIALAVFIISKTKRGKSIGNSIAQNGMLTKGLYRKISRARFLSGMALMLSSGIDTEKSLEMVQDITENEYIAHKVEESKRLISMGLSFEDAAVKSGLFTGLNGRMLSIGFKTGNADEVLQRLANQYSQEIDEEINKKIGMIEPILVAVFSVIIGVILLSVMLPLMGIMSSIG